MSKTTNKEEIASIENYIKWIKEEIETLHKEKYQVEFRIQMYEYLLNMLEVRKAVLLLMNDKERYNPFSTDYPEVSNDPNHPSNAPYIPVKYPDGGNQKRFTETNAPFTLPEYKPYNILGDTEIPYSCKHCSNHPSNGGSGICHCILGLPKITY